MNLKNIEEGMVIKSYRDLCRLLYEPIKSGHSKINQLKDFERYFKYHRNKYKYIIDCIYETPIYKHQFMGGNYKDYPQYKENYNTFNNIGVYSIILDNNIYIGSTAYGFRSRFIGHINGNTENTKDIITNENAEFKILHDMTGIEDEVLIREMENEYIKAFLEKPKWNVLNTNEAWSYTSGHNGNNFFTYNKSIRDLSVPKKDYEKALEIIQKTLCENNIKFYINKIQL